MALKPKQIDLIEAMIAFPMESDIFLAEQIGINRNTVHAWKQKKEFQNELKQRLQTKWADGERVAVETMQALAKEGDFKASKYILDSLGYAPAQKIEADISTDININIEE